MPVLLGTTLKSEAPLLVFGGQVELIFVLVDWSAKPSYAKS
jgi:hypothetical protein